MKSTVDEDVTAFGESLDSVDSGAITTEENRADWMAALDQYDKAKRASDAMRTPAEAATVTEALDEGRYRVACVQARLAGDPVPDRRPPCFFDARHGLSVKDVEYTPAGTVQPRDVPACAACSALIDDGLDPDVRLVAASSGGRQPYWQAGPEYSGYASGYYRGNGMDLFSTILVGTMLGNMMTGGMYGWGGDGGGWSGDSGGGGDFGGGDFGGGDFGGGDFGGAATSAVGESPGSIHIPHWSGVAFCWETGAIMNLAKGFISIVSAIAVTGGLTLAQQPGWAAAPDNDDRADAIRVDPPQTVRGTLVDATLEPGIDDSSCTETDASVWYRFKAPKRGAIVLDLDAAGEMDAVIDLYRQVRSRYDEVNCEVTDSAGIATLDQEGLRPGDDYAIRVGKRSGSVADTFTLRVLVPDPAPEPPGKPLPAKGAKGSVDRLVNSGDAYWTRMRAGQTMRLSLRSDRCMSLTIFPPGTRSFNGYRRSCAGFRLFTPEQTGRYYLVVNALRGRDKQRYRLRTAPARKDDTAPGIFIGNNAKVTGRVNGGIDSRDLYRFDVTRRSTLTLRVTGGPELRLVTDKGRRIARGSDIERRVSVGRYFVAVQGQGKYTLRRVSRTITKTVVGFNGRSSATVSPGSSARLTVRVSPGVDGPARLRLQRFDPIDGWQFARTYRVMVRSGNAQVSFRPSGVGRYRLYGEFRGTRIAADSEDFSPARLRVQTPLQD